MVDGLLENLGGLGVHCGCQVRRVGHSVSNRGLREHFDARPNSSARSRGHYDVPRSVARWPEVTRALGSPPSMMVEPATRPKRGVVPRVHQEDVCLVVELDDHHRVRTARELLVDVLHDH